MADAEKALEFGADALGFNFYVPSPRCIAPEKARAILDALPEHACNVALFVNDSKERVREILAGAVLADGRQAYGALQFHGEESEEYCRGWTLKVIKAFRVKKKNLWKRWRGFPRISTCWIPGRRDTAGRERHFPGIGWKDCRRKD